MNSQTRVGIQRTQSEEDFRTIVANLTSIDREDPIFDRIKEEDKRVIKSAKKAIDMINGMKEKKEEYNKVL